MHFCVHETETWRFCLWHVSWRAIWLTPQSFQMTGQYEVHSSVIYFLGWPQDELIPGNGSSSFSTENLNTWLNVWRQRDSQEASGAMGMPIGWRHLQCCYPEMALTSHWPGAAKWSHCWEMAEGLKYSHMGCKASRGQIISPLHANSAAWWQTIFLWYLQQLQSQGKTCGPVHVSQHLKWNPEPRRAVLCHVDNIAWRQHGMLLPWEGTEHHYSDMAEMPVPRYSRMPGTQLAQADFLHKHMRCCARNQSSTGVWNYNFIKTKCLLWPQPLDISETPEATS